MPTFTDGVRLGMPSLPWGHLQVSPAELDATVGFWVHLRSLDFCPYPFFAPGGKYKAVSQEILGLFSDCAAIQVLSGALYTQSISHLVSFFFPHNARL